MTPRFWGLLPMGKMELPSEDQKSFRETQVQAKRWQLGFQHVKFEASIGHPNGGSVQTDGNPSLEPVERLREERNTWGSMQRPSKRKYRQRTQEVHDWPRGPGSWRPGGYGRHRKLRKRGQKSKLRREGQKWKISWEELREDHCYQVRLRKKEGPLYWHQGGHCPCHHHLHITEDSMQTQVKDEGNLSGSHTEPSNVEECHEGKINQMYRSIPLNHHQPEYSGLFKQFTEQFVINLHLGSLQNIF